MSNAEWHRGPPPSLGWWEASTTHFGPPLSGLYRWWDGEAWSNPVGKHRTAEEAGIMAADKRQEGAHIAWRHRPFTWPASSYT